jgi:hypothetical protein
LNTESYGVKSLRCSCSRKQEHGADEVNRG